MSITRNLIVATAAVLALAACGSDDKSSTSTAQGTATTANVAATTAAPTTAGAPAPTTVAGGGATSNTATVAIGDFKFEPATIDVPAGGTVTWTNDHSQPHTATSAGTFDTGSLAPGASQTITFATAGTFAYICSFHPFMTGTVNVV